MRNKCVKLLVAFILLFCFNGFTQNTEKSLHPLLDKYYPRAETDTNKAVTNQIQPLPPKPAPAVTSVPVVTTAPAMTATPPPVLTTTVTNVTPPASVTTAPATSTALPAVTGTPTLTPPDTTTTAVTGVTTEPTATPAVTTTTSVNRTTTVTVQTPPVQKMPSQPPPPPYMDTRLGSSTKQYDTWEKNNNGAGSVTTSPK